MEVSDDENDICTQDEFKCISEIVKAILVLDHSKKPFKLADITKYLSKKPNRKQWNDVFDKSKRKLKELGLTLVELKNTTTKSYILVSDLFPLPSMYKYASDNDVADRTLLVLVLTYIFVKEGPVTNVDIFNHLQDLGIYSEIEPIHSYFGDVKKKIMADFVGQLYLEKVIDKEDKESDTFEVRWGERAKAEVSKKSILEFVCQIGYERTIEPKNLASHYQEAIMEEEGSEGVQTSECMVVDG